MCAISLPTLRARELAKASILVVSDNNRINVSHIWRLHMHTQRQKTGRLIKCLWWWHVWDIRALILQSVWASRKQDGGLIGKASWLRQIEDVDAISVGRLFTIN